jgi:hypothetical protein
MRTWTLRRGYPLVSVELRGGKALVSQAPFTIDGSSSSAGAGDNETDGSSDGSSAAAAPSSCDAAAPLGAWWLPLAYTTGSDGTLQWSELHGCSGELPGVQLAAADDYLLLNLGRYGFYRSNYSEELWLRLYRAAPGVGRLPAIDYAGGSATFAGPAPSWRRPWLLDMSDLRQPQRNAAAVWPCPRRPAQPATQRRPPSACRSQGAPVPWA